MILRFPDDFQRCRQRRGRGRRANVRSDLLLEPKCPRVIDSGIPHGFHWCDRFARGKEKTTRFAQRIHESRGFVRACVSQLDRGSGREKTLTKLKRLSFSFFFSFFFLRSPVFPYHSCKRSGRQGWRKRTGARSFSRQIPPRKGRSTCFSQRQLARDRLLSDHSRQKIKLFLSFDKN